MHERLALGTWKSEARHVDESHLAGRGRVFGGLVLKTKHGQFGWFRLEPLLAGLIGLSPKTKATNRRTRGTIMKFVSRQS